MTFSEIDRRLQDLSKLITSSMYGRVEVCKYDHLLVRIRVTGDKLDGSLRMTSNLGMLIVNYLPEFPIVVSVNTDKGIFEIALSEKY